MGVFDFFRRKQAIVEPIEEQNVLVEEANEEKPVNNVVTITYGTGKAIDLIYNFLKDDYESKGYDDALTNPDSSYKEMNKAMIKSSLEVKFKQVRRRYQDDLRTIDFHINSRKEAGKYYYANSKHTKILKQYSKFAFLGTYNEPLYNNNTGYSDEEVKSFLVIYEEKFKRPIKDMLRNYYRVKFNPELEMEGYLLDQLGFRPCSHCFS